jgi:hypothetical protein
LSPEWGAPRTSLGVPLHSEERSGGVAKLAQLPIEAAEAMLSAKRVAASGVVSDVSASSPALAMTGEPKCPH